MRQKEYIRYKCTQCGHSFSARGESYDGTFLRRPVRCPCCESLRTRPKSVFGNLDNVLYYGIWKEFELKGLV